MVDRLFCETKSRCCSEFSNAFYLLLYSVGYRSGYGASPSTGGSIGDRSDVQLRTTFLTPNLRVDLRLRVLLPLPPSISFPLQRSTDPTPIATFIFPIAFFFRITISFLRFRHFCCFIFYMFSRPLISFLPHVLLLRATP